MNNLIFQLNNPQATDVKLSGGKGSSLAKLSQAGFNIPPGIIVSSSLFTQYNLDKREDISQNVTQEINDSLSELEGDYFAVRSSAVGEDGKNLSWAGQLETFLWVSKPEVIEKIKECWESIFSAYAQEYIKSNHIEQNELQMAVVVQKMINSETAGVVFTTNPLTKNSNEIVIEACYGLGESLVQGEIIPDYYIVDRTTKQIIQKELSEQTKMLAFISESQKVGWINIPQKEEISPKIDQENMNSLIDQIIKIEKYFRFPCDIEWAIENDQLYILQSRPITTI